MRVEPGVPGPMARAPFKLGRQFQKRGKLIACRVFVSVKSRFSRLHPGASVFATDGAWPKCPPQRPGREKEISLFSVSV